MYRIINHGKSKILEIDTAEIEECLYFMPTQVNFEFKYSLAKSSVKKS